jgi:hypothetical protein
MMFLLGKFAKVAIYPVAAFAIATVLVWFAPRNPLPEWLAYPLVIGGFLIVVCLVSPTSRR